jgi:hypothetical protein
MQERDSHDGAALEVGRQAVLERQELLPLMAQGDARHAGDGNEARLQRAGPQPDRGMALEPGLMRERRAGNPVDGHAARSARRYERYTAVSPPSTLQSAPVT